MRGWGGPPICKASGPDHGLGICAPRNILEEGKKGSMVWVEGDREECRDESGSSRVQGRIEEKQVSSDHWK
jgi:hypothetical protein